jgi:DNA-binding MarR family transcriptional regulator
MTDDADTASPQTEGNWYDEIVIPALLRAARGAYGQAIRAGLAEAGFADVPRNGPFVLGAIARNGSPLAHVINGLGLSKQAAGQLVDTLVIRGYLGRTADADDRRRMTVTLTERGAAAAAAGRAAVERVDADLVGRVGPQPVSQMRAGLGALTDIAQELRDGAVD